jgi:hypothetical protein
VADHPAAVDFRGYQRVMREVPAYLAGPLFAAGAPHNRLGDLMRRLLFAVLLSSCGGSTVIDPARYDRSCVTAADCAPIETGDICTGCGCGGAAINQRDLPRYNADVQRIECTRRRSAPCGCLNVVLACEAGICDLIPASP